MIRTRLEAKSGRFRAGDVVLYRPVVAQDRTRLLAICRRSALRAGLSEYMALSFASAVGHGLLHADPDSDGQAVLTLVRDDDGRLTARVAVQGHGVAALLVERSHKPRTARLVDIVVVQASRRGRLVVASYGWKQPEQPRRWSPPNAGHFA